MRTNTTSAVSRRMVLQTVLGSMAMSVLKGRASGTPTTASVSLGLQAITVLGSFGDRITQTLQTIHSIGYRDIETIGALGEKASMLGKRLRAAGLQSSSQHLCPASFYPEMLAWSRGETSLAKTLAKLNAVYALDQIDPLLDEGIAQAHAVGQKYLIWSYLPPEALASRDGLQRAAGVLNAAAVRARREGLTLGFHNGSKGFATDFGILPYDLLLKETDADMLKMEMDVYWLTKVGADPAHYLRANPGRYALCHLKDMDANGEICPLGKGKIDFRAICATAMSSGTRRFFFEYDQAPQPFADCSDAIEYLRRAIPEFNR